MKHIHKAYVALLGSPPYGAVFFATVAMCACMFVLKILLQTLFSALFFGNSVKQHSQNWEQRRDQGIVWRMVSDKLQMLGIILTSLNVGSLQQSFLHMLHLQMPTSVMIEVVQARNKRTVLFYCQFLGFTPGLHLKLLLIIFHETAIHPWSLTLIKVLVPGWWSVLIIRGDVSFSDNWCITQICC